MQQRVSSLAKVLLLDLYYNSKRSPLEREGRQMRNEIGDGFDQGCCLSLVTELLPSKTSAGIVLPDRTNKVAQKEKKKNPLQFPHTKQELPFLPL